MSSNLGTQFTMEEGFYARRLSEKYGLSVITPDSESRKRMDSIIYKELCVGKFLESSRNEMARMIKGLVDSGAEGIVLGCTELGMILHPEDASVPLFDTTVLTEVINSKKWHWAFYSFREDTWAGMDYELGTKKPGWKYWQAIEKNKMPGAETYKPNPPF